MVRFVRHPFRKTGMRFSHWPPRALTSSTVSLKLLIRTPNGASSLRMTSAITSTGSSTWSPGMQGRLCSRVSSRWSGGTFLARWPLLRLPYKRLCRVNRKGGTLRSVFPNFYLLFLYHLANLENELSSTCSAFLFSRSISVICAKVLVNPSGIKTYHKSDHFLSV